MLRWARGEEMGGEAKGCESIMIPVWKWKHSRLHTCGVKTQSRDTRWLSVLNRNRPPGRSYHEDIKTWGEHGGAEVTLRCSARKKSKQEKKSIRKQMQNITLNINSASLKQNFQIFCQEIHNTISYFSMRCCSWSAFMLFHHIFIKHILFHHLYWTKSFESSEQTMKTLLENWLHSL